MQVITDEQSLPIESIPILASQEYLSVKSENYGWFCNEDYVMPFFIDVKLRFFKRLVITYKPISVKGSEENEKEFLNEVCAYLDSHNLCDHIAKPQANVVFSSYPDKAEFIPWGSYLVNLSLSDEDLLASFHVKHRNVVRKASKDGITVEKTTAIEEVFKCISETLNRQKVHAPSLAYYEKLIKRIPDNVGFYVAKNGSNVEGCAVVIYDENCGYYMYGGSCPKPHTGSLNYLQYEIMRDLKTQGVKTYDLVGARIIYDEDSKYAGIQRFKSRFASEELKGYSFRYIVSPIRFKLFSMAVKAYGLLNGFRYSDTIEDTLKIMRTKSLTQL